MRTDGAIITNAGRELLAYALLNNTEINFTKFKLGKGELNSIEEAKNLRDIISFYKDNPIGFKDRISDSEIMINTSFTNESFPEEVQLKEVGLFATTTGKEEVLFAYINDGVGEIYPAGASGNILERVREVHIGITSDAKVEITIDKSLVFVTVYDLEREFNKCALKTTRLVPGNGIQIQGNDTLANDINIQVKVSDASIIFDANKNITLKKSNTWLNDAATLFTAKGALNLFNDLTGKISSGISDCKSVLRSEMITIKNNLTSLINTKENSFGKNSAFNKNFGTLTGTVLEGHKMAQIQGVEKFGGDVQTTGVKKAGYSYWCTANKEMYECKVENSLNYIDANYFDAFSNSALLGKLQNLIYYGSLGGTGTGSSKNLNELGIFHYCDSSTVFGSGELKVDLPSGWRLLFASVEPRDNINYGDTKVWLSYYQGDTYAMIRYKDLAAGMSAFQVIIFAYR